MLGAGGLQIFLRVTLPNVKWGLLYGVLLCNARAMGEFGAVSVVSGHIRGLTNTMPLHVEILYNEYNFVAAFAVASLLTVLALLTLVLKVALEWRSKRAQRALRASRGDPPCVSRSVAPDQDLRRLQGARGEPGRARGRVLCAPGPVGLRQDDAAADHCRARVPGSGRGLLCRRGRGPARSARAPGRFVFQHYALFRHMSVFENVAFGLRVRPRRVRPSEAQIRERVMELLRLVQLKRFASRYPNQLSGGQRQRVALGRSRSSRAFSCSTSRSARSTPRSGRTCGAGCAICTGAWASPACSSLTTRRRRSSSPTKWS